METVKVQSFSAIIDGIYARLNGLRFDVLSVDWQAVNKTRSILVLRGTNSDREVRIRFVLEVGGESTVEMSAYSLGCKPDTIVWECPTANRVHASHIIEALSPVA